MKIEQVKKCGRFIGRPHLIKHLEGSRLTQREIIEAKCFECMGGYADGPYDCRIPDCPLYPLMPYRGKEPSLSVQTGLEGPAAT
jgi:hypothetical protein